MMPINHGVHGAKKAYGENFSLKGHSI